MQVRPAEIVIIALLAIVLLSLAFLFYNQTLLREEIQTNHQAVQKIHDANVAVALGQAGPNPSQQKPAHQQTQAVPSVEHLGQKDSDPSSPKTQDPGPITRPNPVASAHPKAPGQTDTQPAGAGQESPKNPGQTDPIAKAPYLPQNRPAAQTGSNLASREKAEKAALADYGPTVEQIIKELYQGKYKAVLEKCSPEYADLVGEQIGPHMDKIRSNHGMLKSVMGRRLHDVDAMENQKIFRYTIDTDKGKIVLFTITLQADSKKIDGLFFRQVPLGG